MQQSFKNKEAILKWLSGPPDGAIGFFADDYGIWSTRVVVPQELHRARLMMRNEKVQADYSDWDAILRQRNKWYSEASEGFMCMDSFEEAVAIIRILREQT